MNEREFEQMMQKAQEVHNSPPEVPSDRMWNHIQMKSQVGRAPARRRIWQPAMAMAAVLVIGISIGRWFLPQSEPVMVAVQETAPATYDEEIYQHTALALFDKADVLLTDFRMKGCAPEQMDATSQWAGQLLTQTRVLQGSPVARNNELADLLTDLELVLAQIITINPEQCNLDVAWIRSGLTQRATLDRIRAASARGDRLAAL